MAFAVPLRLGLIGGSLESAVGYTHFASSRLDGFFRIEAGCFSRRWDINEKTGATYGVEPSRIYREWGALLERERDRLDAVVILTPPNAHGDEVIAALNTGYPVISEKPLTTSSHECRLIAKALAENSGFLAVTYNYSGYPMIRELRELIARGDMGSLQQIHVEMPQEGFIRCAPDGTPVIPQDWRLKDHNVPTVSLDLGVHIFHLVHFLTGGSQPVEVVADQWNFGHFKGIVDNVLCIARYSGDLRVQIWLGKTALGYRNGLKVRVFGSKASAEWYQMAPEELLLSHGDGCREVLERGAARLQIAGQRRYNRFKAGHPSGFIEAFANVYADIGAHLRYYLGDTRGASDYVFGVDHSEQGLRFLETIDRSAKEGSWQKVP